MLQYNYRELYLLFYYMLMDALHSNDIAAIWLTAKLIRIDSLIEKQSLHLYY